MSNLSTAALMRLHNDIVKDCVAKIVAVPLHQGGSVSDVVVILESVVAASLLAITASGEEAGLQQFTDGVRRRMAELKSKRAQ